MGYGGTVVPMARHSVPIDQSVRTDWMGRTGFLIAPVVDLCRHSDLSVQAIAPWRGGHRISGAYLLVL
ncbi:hypothetical protein LX76_04760 [Cereibacter changlensis]|uniref:Uncharacterized protein n=1 Tax=Cereibacter changlensis TaxID=402884 RepID=A0A2W7QBY6_9RHOB|nr:hypothetical protein LX76_04760 [Cereibacter changlensis]